VSAEGGAGTVVPVLDRVRRATSRADEPVPVRGGGVRARPNVHLREVEYGDRDEFLTLVHESRALHHPWAYPPERGDQFDELVARARRDDVVTLLGRRDDDDAIFGVFTISQIVRGAFQSAYLGYYGHARYANQGYMGAALEQVLDYVFGALALHRVEANIQPANAPSVALARGAGFRLEGFSPRYLLIGGRWRDHERYAITAEERRTRRR
jgi:[ribosomal protein S5]-alanine N-acetyltransferase